MPGGKSLFAGFVLKEAPNRVMESTEAVDDRYTRPLAEQHGAVTPRVARGRSGSAARGLRRTSARNLFDDRLPETAVGFGEIAGFFEVQHFRRAYGSFLRFTARSGLVGKVSNGSTAEAQLHWSTRRRALSHGEVGGCWPMAVLDPLRGCCLPRAFHGASALFRSPHFGAATEGWNSCSPTGCRLPQCLSFRNRLTRSSGWAPGG